MNPERLRRVISPSSAHYTSCRHSAAAGHGEEWNCNESLDGCRAGAYRFDLEERRTPHGQGRPPGRARLWVELRLIIAGCHTRKGHQLRYQPRSEG